MCVRSPVYSGRDRTSTIGNPDSRCATTSVRKARMALSQRSGATNNVGANLGVSVTIKRPSISHLERPPSRIFALRKPKS